MAANLAASISLAAALACVAAPVPYAPTFVEVVCTPCSFDLYVAPESPGGVPPFAGQCPVVTSACSYNPDIRKVIARAAGDINDTLRVEPAATAGDITLSWDPSCIAEDTDYAVYEGTIGTGYNHEPVLCSTGGATSVTLTPQGANSYYLVVPRNALREGGYGRNSAGVPRPQGAGASAVQLFTPLCP